MVYFCFVVLFCFFFNALAGSRVLNPLLAALYHRQTTSHQADDVNDRRNTVKFPKSWTETESLSIILRWCPDNQVLMMLLFSLVLFFIDELQWLGLSGNVQIKCFEGVSVVTLHCQEGETKITHRVSECNFPRRQSVGFISLKIKINGFFVRDHTCARVWRGVAKVARDPLLAITQATVVIRWRPWIMDSRRLF